MGDEKEEQSASPPAYPGKGIAPEDGEVSPIRRVSNYQRFFVPVVAVSWCLFQLSTATWLILNSSYIRSIHLGFAILLTFLSYPALRRPGRGIFSFLSAKEHIPAADLLLGVTASACALYYYLDYGGISARAGAPLMRDIVIGAALVIVLLEAARRVIGPALPAIAVLFTAYVFFAEHMPGDFAFRSASLGKYVDKISLSTEGIYGIPLDVSATVVFLFVLFGAMLDKAGAGRFFIDLALSVLGRYKGGPAKAAVVGSALTGMVSGSSIANIVTTGTFTIPLMKKVGYSPVKAAAIEVAASTDGQLAPPIMGAAAFIIAEYLGVDYLDVVKAAVIPAFVSYATLLFIVHTEASKAGLQGLRKDETPVFLDVLRGGFHYLLPIGVLIYELAVPRHSPQTSVVRAIAVLAVIMVFQGPIRSFMGGSPRGPAFRAGLKSLLDAAVSAGRNMVPVAIACAAAGIIVGVVTMGIGSIVTELVELLSGGSIFGLIAITAAASLLLGMGLPTTPTYIVMAVLTAPIILKVGLANGFVVPLLSAHLFCFYFGILADDTPPVGLAAFTASAIAGSPPIKTGVQGFLYDLRTAMIAFMFIFNSDLILHNIHSWGLAAVIFIAACIGNFSFASVTQGWFVVKNKWYEVLFLLVVAFVMMQPAATAEWLGIGNKYLIYPAGLALSALVYLNQKRRRQTLADERTT